MSNFTNEVPENMDDILQRLKLYIDKSYNKTDKSKVQKIVSNCKLSLTKTGQWGERWGYAQATAIMTIPSDVFDIIDNNVNKNLCSIIDIILQSTDCGLEIISLDFIPGNIVQSEEEQPELEVLFEEQKNKIIKEISDAKFSVWIAVAWFTLDEIYDLLVQKRKDGLDIRIIISKDDINKSKYDKYKSALNIWVYPKFGVYNDNLMHNKFCIIDLERLYMVLIIGLKGQNTIEKRSKLLRIEKLRKILQRSLKNYTWIYTNNKIYDTIVRFRLNI